MSVQRAYLRSLEGNLGHEGGVRLRHGDDWYFQRFRDYLLLEAGLAERTAKGYVADLVRLARYVGKPIISLEPDDLRGFVREADCSPSTKLRTAVSARQFYSWAALEGHRKLDAIVAVRTPKIVRKPKARVSDETARLLLSSVRTALEYRVVFFGLYAGLRIAESASVGEGEWRGDRLVIVGKGRKQRDVPVHPELAKVRHHILEKIPKDVQVLHSSLRRMRERVRAYDTEGNPVRSHALRRTFGQALYDSGTPWEIVRKVLGHGEDVTDLYVRVRFEQMKEPVSRVTYFKGEPVQLGLFE